MRRRRFVALAASAGSAAIAGCGDASDDPDAESTDRAEGQQQVGGDGATGNGTVTEGATSTEGETEEPTASETGTEDETDTETPDETDTETPDETDTETATESSSSGSGSGAERRSVEYPEDSVDVRNVEYDANRDADAGPTVTGDVQNVSRRSLSYVEARVDAYGEGDEHLGDALDDTTDLGVGETWSFDCELWDTDADAVEYWTLEVSVSEQ